MAQITASVRRYLWIAPVLLGLFFIGIGAFMVQQGVSAKDEVHDTLVAEQITTSDDAEIPGVLVDSPATARAQARIIREHTLGNYGPYSSMDREDPNRDVYIKGVTLRTALNQAAMGFKVSDLVIGVGALTIVMGASSILLLAPAFYFIRQEAPGAARARDKRIGAPAPAAGT